MIDNRKEQARALYSQGVPDGEIAQRLGVVRRTIINWRNKARNTPDDWGTFKQAIAPVHQSPKVVDFESRSRSDSPPPEPIDVGDLNGLEGQLQLIDNAISKAMGQVESPVSPQQYSAALNALPRLLAERRQIRPIDRMDYLRHLMTIYRDPMELISDLKANGWGNKA